MRNDAPIFIPNPAAAFVAGIVGPPDMMRRSTAPVPPQRSDRITRPAPVHPGRIDLSSAPSAMETRAAAWTRP